MVESTILKMVNLPISLFATQVTLSPQRMNWNRS